MVRAKERGVPIDVVTEETIGWYREDMAALGTLPPTHEPRATEYVGQMVSMIEALIAKGHAYEAEGHVLFEVGTYSNYGKLSGRSTDDMIAGARVEVAPYKRDPMDFVLWKPSTDEQPGWDSPWGRGRPGWHIECSAMSSELLGNEFDIHGGGSDLQFPHHENEIAQSCCAHPEAGFAKLWMHNGMINVDGRKMSKSLGNFLTVEDLRNQAPGEVLRLAILSTHYRGVLDWTQRRLDEVQSRLNSWSKPLREKPNIASDQGLLVEAGVDRWTISALADDLNTPQAFAALDRLASKARELSEEGQIAAASLYTTIKEFFAVDLIDYAHSRSVKADLEVILRIQNLLSQRAEARELKDFARADEIRDGLVEAGVEVMDKPGKPSEGLPGPNFDAAKLEALR